MPSRRLLFLSHRLPFPPHNGAAIRTFNILRILARAYAIDMLCFDRRDSATAGTSQDERIAGLEGVATTKVFPIPQEWSTTRLLIDHGADLLAGRPYTHSMHRDAGFMRALHAALALQRYDLVHVDSLDLVGYLGELPIKRTALTHHNIESDLLRQRGDGDSVKLRGAYIRRQAAMVEAAERKWAPQVGLNVMVSAADQRRLEDLAGPCPAVVVPNGVDTAFFSPAPATGTDLVFVGGLSYRPNLEGLAWYCAEVEPHLSRAGCAVRLTAIGRASATQQQAASPGGTIQFTGYVPDIRPYLRNAGCFIAPLLTGGGTRLKILDAWAMGVPVISTSVACDGLDAIDNENILVRDNPGDFADAIREVLGSQPLRERLRAAGRATAERVYDWEVVGRVLLDSYQRLEVANT